MGYFSKDAYDRKREWAYRTSSEGIESIAVQLVAERHGDGDWRNLDDDAIDSMDREVDELREELQPIARLSHGRHEIHSTDRWSFVANNAQSLLNEIGDAFSDGSVIDEVNSLNDRYGLVGHRVPYIDDGDIPTDDDSTEDIFEYFGEEMDGNRDEDELRDEALQMLYYAWDEIINRWSSSVREWFGELNARFGTDFPS